MKPHRHGNTGAVNSALTELHQYVDSRRQCIQSHACCTRGLHEAADWKEGEGKMKRGKGAEGKIEGRRADAQQSIRRGRRQKQEYKEE